MNKPHIIKVLYLYSLLLFLTSLFKTVYAYIITRVIHSQGHFFSCKIMLINPES